MTLEELSKLVESKKHPVIVNRGVTPLSLLGIAFIVMKLMGYITWSWWLVLAPFWIPICIGIIILFFVFGIMVIVAKGACKVTIKKEDSEPKEKEEPLKKTSKKNSTKKKTADEGTERKNA